VSALPARVAWAVDLVDPGPADRVLEVGCGPGVAAALIAARLTTGRLVAVDRSAVAVRRTAARVADVRAAAPGSAEPGVAEPGAAQPGAASALLADARLAGLGVTEPGVAEPGAASALLADARLAGPGVTGERKDQRAGGRAEVTGAGAGGGRDAGAVVAGVGATGALVAAAPVDVRQAGLGDLDYVGEFDAAFTIDVNVFWTRPQGPELGVLVRALRPGGRVLILYGAEGPAGPDRVTGPIAAAMSALGLTDIRVVTGEHGIGVVGHRPGLATSGAVPSAV